MENATKALLIAASVLIVIVLIAVGVLLLGNISDSSEQAQKVGNSIDIATDSAVSDAIGGLKKSIISKEKFNDFAKDFSSKYKSFSQVMNVVKEQNGKLSNQIEVVGYVYQKSYSNIVNERTARYNELLAKFDSTNHEKNKEYYEYVINEWIVDLEGEGKLKKISDPLSTDCLRNELREVYKNNKGEYPEKVLAKSLWYFDFDKWGYINKAVYISGMNF